MVTLGEGADAEIDAREIEPLAGPQFAAHDHPAGDLVALDRQNVELNDAVIQEKRVTGFDRLRQSLEGDRGPSRIADDVVGGQDKGVAGFQFHRLLRQACRCASWGRKGRAMIATRLSGGTGRCSQVPDHCAVAVEIAVGKVEAGDVHPGPHHLFHDLRLIPKPGRWCRRSWFYWAEASSHSVSFSADIRANPSHYIYRRLAG